jgi:hypothetical protein
MHLPNIVTAKLSGSMKHGRKSAKAGRIQV